MKALPGWEEEVGCGPHRAGLQDITTRPESREMHHHTNKIVLFQVQVKPNSKQ